MSQYLDQAVKYHSSWHSCSASVLMAYRDVLGLSEREAERIASPMAGGNMGTCGAVLAAEYVLEQSGRKEDARALREAFEAKNGASLCREIRGKRLRSCRGCVIDASTLLDDILKK